jgi:hypothetical protein
MKLHIKKRKKLTKRLSAYFHRYRRHSSRLRYVPVIFIVTGALIASYLYIFQSDTPTASPNDRLVTFHDRGKDHVILTRATSVRKALEDANISVDPKDVVEPAIDSELLSTDSAVIIYRARPVLVVDGPFREKVLTAAQSPNEIATAAGINQISDKDKTSTTKTDFIADGASIKLVIERAAPEVVKPVFAPTPQALTASKGAQLFVDSSGVAHRETYYDLPMNVVIGSCGGGDYTIRYDGAKIDKDGYVLVAANYRVYPKCSVVETSMGPGKVYDTGGFALRYPHGFDLATDWSNNNGR